jgi:hypothetical protein
MCPIALADPLFSGAHVQVFKHYEHCREGFYPAVRRRKIKALKIKRKQSHSNYIILYLSFGQPAQNGKFGLMQNAKSMHQKAALDACLCDVMQQQSKSLQRNKSHAIRTLKSTSDAGTH